MGAMSAEETRPSLLARLRDPNDQLAWRTFDASYRELILRYAQRRGLQVADAEDVRQVVMLKLAQHMAQFRYQPELGRFRDYLGAIVRHAVLRHAKKQNSEPVSANSVELMRGEGTIDAQWHEEWVLHHYRLAMASARATFSESSCSIFDQLLAGREPARIASDHGITTAAVYKVKQRFRDRMRAEVELQLHQEDSDPQHR